MGIEKMEDIEDVEDIETTEETTDTGRTDGDGTGDGDGDEGDEGEGDNEDEGDGDGEGDEDLEDEDSELGARAQKRIKALNGRAKDAEARVESLEKELKAAKELSGDDGKAILAAAEKTGILPGLMTKNEAEAFRALVEYPNVIEHYRDWLDDHESGDELDTGNGRTMTYGEVRKRVRHLTSEMEDLKDRYGDKQKELRKKVKTIFELGLEAYRKGEGANKGKQTPAKKAVKTQVVRHDKPTGRSPVAGSGKKLDWGSVSGTNDLVRMLRRQNKER